MQTLPILIAEMRMMGVRRLELELDSLPVEVVTPDTVPAEPEIAKPEGSCAWGECTQPREGLFGGTAGAQFCRAHALAGAGVKL
jgi:hypothetical protein